MKSKYLIWKIDHNTKVPSLYEEGVLDTNGDGEEDIILTRFGSLVEMDENETWALRFERPTDKEKAAMKL